MPGYLGNFQIPTDIWVWYIFKILEISQMTGYVQDPQAFWEFPKYPDIWGISQIPSFLGNSPNIQSFEKFPKS